MTELLNITENVEIEDKYLEILEYLKQDDGYWLYNDKWDVKKNSFYGKSPDGTRHIRFDTLKKETLKNEFKYFVLRSFKDDLYKSATVRKISNYFRIFRYLL